ncbi:MAG: hypothetical protein IJD35_02290 [Clostridia bacterium]|nr:hypothetical protein [Clostridia bacterium]
MARKISLLVVVLIAVVSLSLILVACGGSNTSTTTAGTTTKAPTTTPNPAVTTTTPTTDPATPTGSTATPGNDTTPNSSVATTPKAPVTLTPVTYRGENEKWIEEVLFEEGQWVEPHEEYRLTAGKGNDGTEYEYMWYFSFKAEGGHFGTTADDHPTHPATPGIQLVTEPVALYIKDANDENADYEKYNITYWATASWYQIYCVADGFVPVDGTAYDVYLVFRTPADTELEDGTVIYNGSNYPDQYHYIWDLGEAWIYKAPQKSESKYLSQAQLDQIKGDSFWLLENEPTTVTADGSVQVKFKSDGNPFNNESDTKGVAFTLFGELYINGEEYKIEDGSYLPEQWYILNFKVKDFTPVAGETYEIIFTITSNDPTGTYCAYSSYYVLAAAVTFAG